MREIESWVFEKAIFAPGAFFGLNKRNFLNAYLESPIELLAVSEHGFVQFGPVLVEVHKVSPDTPGYPLGVHVRLIEISTRLIEFGPIGVTWRVKAKRPLRK